MTHDRMDGERLRTARLRSRWAAAAFACGSVCFLIGPIPGYLQAVGAPADAITFFVGSLLFTAGGALQLLQAAGQRRSGGRADWWAAALQSVGTVAFNVSTGAALVTAVSAAHYDRLVWRPDAIGSACFLLSGGIAYAAASRSGRWLARNTRGGWRPAVNLLGCILFGAAAVAGLVVPATASLLAPAVANWATSAGAACFLACALASLPVAHPAEHRDATGARSASAEVSGGRPEAGSPSASSRDPRR